MVSSGMRVIKYLLFIFNFIFFVTGGCLLGLGIYVKIHAEHYLSFVGSNYLTGPILLIAVGCIITVIAFFGCCGAAKESHCMIITFSVLLGIIFVLELAAGIAAYVLHKDLDEIIHKNLEKQLGNYYNDTSDQKNWNVLQHDFKCCGISNSTDWKKNHLDIPDSCCEIYSEECAKTGSSKIWKDGCYKKLKDFLSQNIVLVGGIGIGIAFIQIIGIVCACCLAAAIKREYEIV